jgi:hypothetical protein
MVVALPNKLVARGSINRFESWPSCTARASYWQPPAVRMNKGEVNMFGALEKLTKAAVGAVIETPVSIVADVVTMGGALTDKKEPYTASSIKKVVKNIGDSTK